jgi:hypothetical protein
MTLSRFRSRALAALAFAAGALFTARFLQTEKVQAQNSRGFRAPGMPLLARPSARVAGPLPDHTIRIFTKHHMTSVAYWTPQDASTKDNTLIYVLAHDSRESARKNWAEFVADPEWKQVAKD